MGDGTLERVKHRHAKKMLDWKVENGDQCSRSRALAVPDGMSSVDSVCVSVLGKDTLQAVNGVDG